MINGLRIKSCPVCGQARSCPSCIEAAKEAHNQRLHRSLLYRIELAATIDSPEFQANSIQELPAWMQIFTTPAGDLFSQRGIHPDSVVEVYGEHYLWALPQDWNCEPYVTEYWTDPRLMSRDEVLGEIKQRDIRGVLFIDSECGSKAFHCVE